MNRKGQLIWIFFSATIVKEVIEEEIAFWDYIQS